AAAPAAAHAAPLVLLPTLGDQVLRDGRLVEVLVVDELGAARCGRDADLRIPHGAERGGRTPRGRRHLLVVLVAGCGSGSPAGRRLGLGERPFSPPARPAAAPAAASAPAPPAALLAVEPIFGLGLVIGALDQLDELVRLGLVRIDVTGRRRGPRE